MKATTTILFLLLFKSNGYTQTLLHSGDSLGFNYTEITTKNAIPEKVILAFDSVFSAYNLRYFRHSRTLFRSKKILNFERVVEYEKFYLVYYEEKIPISRFHGILLISKVTFNIELYYLKTPVKIHNSKELIENINQGVVYRPS